MATGALAALNQALRLNPSDALAYMHKGFVLGQLGRRQEALAALQMTVRLDPNLAKYITEGLSNS